MEGREGKGDREWKEGGRGRIKMDVSALATETEKMTLTKVKTEPEVTADSSLTESQEPIATVLPEGEIGVTIKSEPMEMNETTDSQTVEKAEPTEKVESVEKTEQNLSILDQLKQLPEPPSLSKEPIVLQLRELNPYITCALCGGYLYEASTITECMHTFCKTCIVRHTERHLSCPTCDTPIHPTDPFVHIRHDSTLQDIVYRLLPTVAEEEERREREFCEKHERETGEQILPRLQLPPPPPKTPPPPTDRPPLPSEVCRKKKEREITLGNFQSQFVSLLLHQISEEEDGDEYFDLEKKFVRVTQKATIGNVANFIRKKLHLGNIYDVDIFITSEDDENIQMLEPITTLQFVRDAYFRGQMSSQLFSAVTFDDVEDDVKSIMTPETKRHLWSNSPLQEIVDTYRKNCPPQSISAESKFIQRRHRSFESRRSLFKRRLEDENHEETPVKRLCSALNACFSPVQERQETVKLSPEDSKTLINRALGQGDLTGDGLTAFCLPTIPGKHSDLKSIAPETMADLLNGAYDDTVENFRIIDCRYPYEYQGGHIKGAENIYTEEGVLELLHTSPLGSGKGSKKRNILIFHCEFSSERGPKKCRFLRNMDRKLNKDCYPYLNFPEVYLLHGGYKDFFTHCKSLCMPQTYTPMLDKSHADDLRLFRRKSKSWTAGEKRKHALQNLRF
ncbi:hypothetical protein FSP39_025184 [Pinctada imbricata]|uniref:M-phase inducer phosphatase n=1 Tax=Pinctada imbricata TaxID=66713 RepID=A0AA89C255_PINIB|nr:hypothetical protein FSP39_025184 [Pinctada imbricata]